MLYALIQKSNINKLSIAFAAGSATLAFLGHIYIFKILSLFIVSVFMIALIYKLFEAGKLKKISLFFFLGMLVIYQVMDPSKTFIADMSICILTGILGFLMLGFRNNLFSKSS